MFVNTRRVSSDRDRSYFNIDTIHATTYTRGRRFWVTLSTSLVRLQKWKSVMGI